MVDGNQVLSALRTTGAARARAQVPGRRGLRRRRRGAVMRTRRQEQTMEQHRPHRRQQLPRLPGRHRTLRSGTGERKLGETTRGVRIAGREATGSGAGGLPEQAPRATTVTHRPGADGPRRVPETHRGRHQPAPCLARTWRPGLGHVPPRCLLVGSGTAGISSY